MIPLEQLFAQQARVASIRPIIVSHLSESQQSQLLDALIASKAPRAYSHQVLRILLTAIESADRADPAEDLITTYAGLMVPSASDDGAVPRSGGATPVYYRFGPHLLTVYESRNTLVQFGGTGYRTWEAALALGDYFISQCPIDLKNRRLVELGAGTGFAGMVASCLGAKATLTDGDPNVVKSLRDTVAANNLTADVQDLYWSPAADLSEFANSLVIAADVLYDVDIFPAFLDVVKRLLSSCEVIVSTTIRNEDSQKEFLAQAAALTINVQVLATYEPSDDPMQEPSEFFWFGPGPRIEILRLSL